MRKDIYVDNNLSMWLIFLLLPLLRFEQLLTKLLHIQQSDRKQFKINSFVWQINQPALSGSFYCLLSLRTRRLKKNQCFLPLSLCLPVPAWVKEVWLSRLPQSRCTRMSMQISWSIFSSDGRGHYEQQLLGFFFLPRAANSCFHSRTCWNKVKPSALVIELAAFLPGK